jgi:hypothetical protein
MGFLVTLALGFDYPDNAEQAMREAQRVIRDPRIPIIYTVLNKETNEVRRYVTND